MILPAIKPARTVWFYLVNICFLAALSAGCTPAFHDAQPIIGEEEVTPSMAEIKPVDQVESMAVTTAAEPGLPSLVTLSPTVTPSPTAIDEEPNLPVLTLTEIPIFTAETPTFSLPTASPEPTLTPDDTPQVKIPDAAIQVFRPGPASKVVSPIRVSTFLLPGYQGNVIIELFGEDGRLLVRKVFAYRQNPGVRLQVNTDLDFEISAVAESARLVIRTEDQNNHTISLAAVDLILLSLGQEENNPPGDLKEKIAIIEPVRNLSIKGGVIYLTGFARPSSPDPLLVELYSEKGAYLAPSRLIAISLEDDSLHAPFAIEIPYSITQPTNARLIITEKDYRRMETLHVSSVEIHLRP
jgi:hypothetical protein